MNCWRSYVDDEASGQRAVSTVISWSSPVTVTDGLQWVLWWIRPTGPRRANVEGWGCGECGVNVVRWVVSSSVEWGGRGVIWPRGHVSKVKDVSCPLLLSRIPRAFARRLPKFKTVFVKSQRVKSIRLRRAGRTDSEPEPLRRHKKHHGSYSSFKQICQDISHF